MHLLATTLFRDLPEVNLHGAHNNIIFTMKIKLPGNLENNH